MELEIITKNKITTIKMQRPHRKNALTFPMYRGITKGLNDASKDDSTKIVVITGSGDYFSSGNDLNNYMNIGQGGDDVVGGAVQMIREFVAAFINCEKPIVALVNGPAVGIATTILGLCDVVLASSTVTFKTPFTELGLSPEGCSSYTFPKILGYAKAAKVLLFNEPLTVDEAYIAGLVSEVIPAQDFERKCTDYLNRWVELPNNSLVYSKKLIRSEEKDLLLRVNDLECDRLSERATSEECMEAAMKFFSKKSKI